MISSFAITFFWQCLHGTPLFYGLLYIFVEELVKLFGALTLLFLFAYFKV